MKFRHKIFPTGDVITATIQLLPKNILLLPYWAPGGMPGFQNPGRKSLSRATRPCSMLLNIYQYTELIDSRTRHTRLNCVTNISASFGLIPPYFTLIDLVYNIQAKYATSLK